MILQLLDFFLRQPRRLHDRLYRQIHRFHRLCDRSKSLGFAFRFTLGKTGGMPFLPGKVNAVPVIVFRHHIVSV